MRVSSFVIPRAIVATASCFLATIPAWADLRTAQVAYTKGDLAGAFEQFKELAELGQPEAQFDLAAMYAMGKGVNPNKVYAHAWASLAARNGESKGKQLADDLAPDLTPTSQRISAEIQEQFSQKALDARLMPRFFNRREYEDRDPVRPSKPFIPEYPMEAEHKGIQGEVYVEFVVAPDGHPRIPRILYAVPEGYFESAVRESVLRSVYLPARTNGQPISTAASIMYNFTVPGVSIKDYQGLERRVHDTELKATAGDPQAQMLYAMMIAGLPQLKQTYSQALPWFLKAAQAGAPYAQYQIGTGLLQGRGCQCDAGKGEIWLQKAAQADQPDAQVSLAEYLLRGEPAQEAVEGALVWLERAAKQRNASAKLMLSSILAATPYQRLRDPARALILANSVEHEYSLDPSFWEVRAAAQAALGDFRAAAKAQTKAVSEATYLGWNLVQLQQRQSLYEAGQSFSGNPLAF